MFDKQKIDCRNALEAAELLSANIWLPWESVTIGALMKLNRDGHNVLDVLLGITAAEVNCFHHLDWVVSAEVRQSSRHPVLARCSDGNVIARWEQDNAMCMVLRVSDAKGRLAVYLIPRELDSIGQCEWMPSWTMSDVIELKGNQCTG